MKRREVKSKGEKERYTHLNAEFQRIARRDKKAFLSDQCKEIEETIEWERLEISSTKLEIPRDISCKDGLNKGLHSPMECNLPGSSVDGISQARILEWVAIFFSRRSS